MKAMYKKGKLLKTITAIANIHGTGDEGLTSFIPVPLLPSVEGEHLVINVYSTGSGEEVHTLMIPASPIPL